MAEKYINIRVILDKLLRNPLLSDLTLESVIDYTVDFFRIVGVPRMFINKIATITIQEHRGLLPCDIVEVNQVRYKGICMRESTSSFYLQDFSSIDNTFIIQGNYIYTSIHEGEVEISYRAIATDSEGYPLLPDNSKFTRALSSYIKCEYYNILFDQGKIPQQVYSNAQQQYAFNVGACETEFLKLDLNKAESFFNSFRTLISRERSFYEGFENDGAKELIRVQ